MTATGTLTPPRGSLTGAASSPHLSAPPPTIGVVPYRDVERRRQAKRESARRARSRHTGRVDPVGPVDPNTASVSVKPARPAGGDPANVGPDVDPGCTAAAVLAVVLSELDRVRNYSDADPLARGRVVAAVAGVALHATKVAALEAQITALEAQVAQLHATAQRTGPRRIA